MKELCLSGRLICAVSFCFMSMAVLYGALSLTVETERIAPSGSTTTIPCPEVKVLTEWIDHIPGCTAASCLPTVEEPAIKAVEYKRDLPDRGQRDDTIILSGIASWYGGSDGFDGSITASGEIFDASAYTAAHPTLPFGTRVRVTFQKTGLSVEVRINDRGPFVPGRIIDLSRAAAALIGLKPYGIGLVDLELLD